MLSAVTPSVPWPTGAARHRQLPVVCDPPAARRSRLPARRRRCARGVNSRPSGGRWRMPRPPEPVPLLPRPVPWRPRPAHRTATRFPPPRAVVRCRPPGTPRRCSVLTPRRRVPLRSSPEPLRRSRFCRGLPGRRPASATQERPVLAHRMLRSPELVHPTRASRAPPCSPGWMRSCPARSRSPGPTCLCVGPACRSRARRPHRFRQTSAPAGPPRVVSARPSRSPRPSPCRPWVPRPVRYGAARSVAGASLRGGRTTRSGRSRR